MAEIIDFNPEWSGKNIWLWDTRTIQFPRTPPIPVSTEDLLQRPDYILMGWRQPYAGRIEAYYIPVSGPRHICISFCRDGDNWYYMGHAIRKKMQWDSPECHCTDALCLLPPNPDRRTEYLRQQEDMRAAKNEA
jgi:hypothetical protein